MNEGNIGKVIGSERRDIFRRLHLSIPNAKGWACLDIDFRLIDIDFRLPICNVEIKKVNESLTKTQVISNDWDLSKGLDTYIIEEDFFDKEISFVKQYCSDKKEMTRMANKCFSRFKVYKYVKGDSRDLVCENAMKWEHEIRQKFKKVQRRVEYEKRNR